MRTVDIRPVMKRVDTRPGPVSTLTLLMMLSCTFISR